ncbi:enoyl-CoA hydratase [Sphingobium lactosutens]|mgnify:CR=1 FL=1|uniref:crotonase/enoyl-CoA hydratase family protein n=1 Tax=Sphingobium lactosutens TaxID=522773 RepID=UPI0015B815D1|nr:crotonase/enoyl-CoA hydratase family protein [Sphingobium lactosutens]NWK96248.1 enoyl-CoA hydratase [Sphingobium lactosutens]
MDYQSILFDVADRVATITLHRPDKMNAFTTQMMLEMIHAFDRVDADDGIRAVVVTGAGRAYCAGADISGGAEDFLADPDIAEQAKAGTFDFSDPSVRDGGGLLTLRIFRMEKPVIGAINGAAVGIGATMTLPMDIRLASEQAKFGFVFARRGIVPEAASTYFLPRIVGINRALKWCYSGRVFGAAEAKEGGLVEDVLPVDDLLPAAYAIAREIADNAAPVSIALTRQMMWRGLGLDDPMEAHRIESRGILTRSLSDDAKEGVTAFFEKRAPDFPDRVSRDMPSYYPWWTERPYG